LYVSRNRKALSLSAHHQASPPSLQVSLRISMVSVSHARHDSPFSQSSLETPSHIQQHLFSFPHLSFQLSHKSRQPQAMRAMFDTYFDDVHHLHSTCIMYRSNDCCHHRGKRIVAMEHTVYPIAYRYEARAACCMGFIRTINSLRLTQGERSTPCKRARHMKPPSCLAKLAKHDSKASLTGHPIWRALQSAF
jgi:hypothetical protein